MLIKDTGGGDYEYPEVGTYIATCRQIIDLGTQENDYQGAKTYPHQILMGWELNENMSDGRPFVVSKFYTASLNEKANFRKDLISWRGRDFTQEELGGFDPRNILGAPCMLTLTTNEKGKIKVSSVAKIVKGMSPPPLVNPKVYFSLQHGEYDQQQFEALSEGIKKIIMQSPEWQARQAELGMAHQPAESDEFAPTTQAPYVPPTDDDFPDDIPF